MAECELSVLSRQCLDRRIDDLNVLNTELAAWQNATNADQRQVQLALHHHRRSNPTPPPVPSPLAATTTSPRASRQASAMACQLQSGQVSAGALSTHPVVTRSCGAGWVCQHHSQDDGAGQCRVARRARGVSRCWEVTSTWPSDSWCIPMTPRATRTLSSTSRPPGGEALRRSSPGIDSSSLPPPMEVWQSSLGWLDHRCERSALEGGPVSRHPWPRSLYRRIGLSVTTLAGNTQGGYFRYTYDTPRGTGNDSYMSTALTSR